MKVTVTQNGNTAIFTWDDNAESCEYTGMGFEEHEIDQIIESKAYMGKQVEGYEVEVDF